jgi:integrase
VNRSLPSRWRYRHGAFYYRVPPRARQHWDNKTEFRLGTTLAEAHATFAQRIGYEGEVRTMDQLCDRYTLEVVSEKAPATQRSNQYSLQRIRRAFSGNRVHLIEPRHIYQYRDHIGRTESKKKANLDLEVLSHMFTKSIEWGLRSDHPMTNRRVTKFSLEHRKVLPTIEEVTHFASGLPPQFQLYVALKVWTGRRKGELLRLERRHLTEHGMVFTDNKRGGEILVPWEDETRAIVRRLLSLPGASLFVFHTRAGRPYIKDDGTTSGFDSVWQRHARRWREGGGKHFTEHDLRKVRASQMSQKQAQALLNHATGATTGRYQLGPKVLEIGSK